MARTVRGALVQASWTGDKESMIQKHEAYAHEAAKAGCPGHPVPGAVLRTVLLPGPGRPVLQLHRADPGRPDDQADAGPRQGDRHGRRRADVRGGRAGLGHLLQHRRGHRRRRQVPRQVPQDPHPAREGVLGEVLLPARATWAIRSSRRRSARSASTSATTGTSRKAPGRSGLNGAEIVLHPVGDVARPAASTCGASSSRATPSPTATTSGRSTGSASRPTTATTTSTARATSSTRAASSSATSDRPTTRS